MSNKSGQKNSGGRMTQAAASRIQSAASRGNGGKTPAGSFASRAQSSAARRVNSSSSRQGGGKK